MNGPEYRVEVARASTNIVMICLFYLFISLVVGVASRPSRLNDVSDLS